MTGLEVLGRELSMSNEHRLGGGGRALWVPPFPSAVDLPGFRDQGRFGNRILAPVFGLNLLDEHGRLIPAKASERRWNPARLELRYRLSNVMITERRTVMSCDAFVSQWTMVHASEAPVRFWVVAWTKLDCLDGLQFAEVDANPRCISVQQAPAMEAANRARSSERFGFALGASIEADSWSIDAGKSQTPMLDWSMTPFFERMTPRGLCGQLPSSYGDAGELRLAMAYPIEVRPGERLVASFIAAVSEDVEIARNNLEAVAQMVNPIQSSEEEWITWFEEAPSFCCSNLEYQKLYWSRWAERRLWRSWRADAHDHGLGCLNFETGAIIENAWRLNSDEAIDGLTEILERPPAEALRQQVGLAARRLLALHPEMDLLADLEELAERLTFETFAGTSVFSEAAERVDGIRPDDVRRIAALDLIRLAAWIADKEGCDPTPYEGVAKELGEAIRGEQKDKAGVGTPLEMLAALAGAMPCEQKQAAVEALFDPDQFWTAYPLPSLNRTDPRFRPQSSTEAAENLLGRVWPALNSLVIDAVAAGIERESSLCRLALTRLIDQTLRLALTPSSTGNEMPRFHEHYHPHNGRPGMDISPQRPAGGWPIDHLLRYVAGIRPREDGKLLIDPLPFGLEWFVVDRLFVGDREFRVEWNQRSGIHVRVDQEPAAHAPVGRALAMNLPEHWPSDDRAFHEAILGP